MTARRRSPFERWGVRRRSTAAAGLLILLVVAVAGAVLLELLHRTAVGAAHDQAVARQAEILQDLGVPWQPRTAGGTARETAVYTTSGLGELMQRMARPGVLVQLQDADGRLVAASPASTLDAGLSPPTLEPGQSFDSAGDTAGPGPRADDFVYVSHGMYINDVPFTLTVAVPMALQQTTIRTVSLFLVVGGPVLALLGSALMWFLVGRSLAPVRRITGQVRRIGTANLGERVDVPPTGDEVAALAGTMNGMLDRLEASDRAQRRFVADASHELRSPLATLTTTIEVAASDPSATMWPEVAPVLRSQSRRMGRLVEDLLTLAKVDDAGLRLRVADTDLDEVVREEVARMRPASRHEVRVHVEPVRIRGDGSRLQQVLRNLLSNAERHAESWIAVSLRTEGQEAVVTVDNDGTGIAPQDRERVFERFVRLDDSRTRDTGGSGLGLAISREIASAHGGTITAGDDGKGHCRFELRLPLGPGGAGI
ncbi:HAMP domain-containing protein [Kocuria sediminis]|uniref:histidine kinase n=1 Tax=Kocuria sediminis TaxID=1038857 RepID=A0A6N8GL26_9MICC|nr:HAMP domain-containing protein [Kocuria sediminis]